MAVRGLRALPEPPPQAGATQNHGHTQPLAHAHAQRQQAQVGVGFAEVLGDETEHAIPEQEGGTHLPRRALLARIEPQQAASPAMMPP